MNELVSLLKLKKRLADVQSELDRVRGVHDLLKANLKEESGTDDLEFARLVLEAQEKEVDSIEQEFSARMNKLSKDLDDLETR